MKDIVLQSVLTCPHDDGPYIRVMLDEIIQYRPLIVYKTRARYMSYL